jgi:hypothetical protein
MREKRILTAALAVAIGGLLSVGVAHGALVTQTFPGNDCSGQPGCVATESGVSTTGEGSPWIIKFNIGGEIEINSALFPTITADDFSFTGLGGSSGTWTYTPDAGDPDVKFWVAKGGPNFNFFYENGADNTGPAIAVTSGTWSTPDGQGLSHIAFYDTASVIPEPGTLLLLGTGLAGVGTWARRRRRARLNS